MREGYQEKYVGVVENLLSNCKQEFKDKESLTDFNFKIK